MPVSYPCAQYSKQTIDELVHQFKVVQCKETHFLKTLATMSGFGVRILSTISTISAGDATIEIIAVLP